MTLSNMASTQRTINTYTTKESVFLGSEKSLNVSLKDISNGSDNYDVGYKMNGNLSANFEFNDSILSYDFGDFFGPDMTNIEAIIRRSFWNHTNPVVIILLILYIFSFVWGFLGNILVIHVFTRTRKMRTVTNVFLVNLAICDLMVVCLCMPFSAAQAIYSDWIYGDVWCKLMNFFQGLSVTSSILTLTVISAERFYAIKHPLKARAFMTRDRVVKIIVSIWLVCAVAMTPSLFVRKENEVPLVSNVALRSCVEQWASKPMQHFYNFSLLLLLYIGPIIFICIGYFRIGSDLWRSDSALFASRDAAKSGNAVRNLSARRKVAKMLFVIAVLFALSWLPFDTLLVTLDFLPNEILEKNGIVIRYIFDYALWLAHANSSVNPVCYCIMSQSFKHAFNQEFKRCCRRHRFQRGASMSSQSNSVTMTTAANFPRTKQSSCVFKNTTNGYTLVCLSRGNTNKREMKGSKRDKVEPLSAPSVAAANVQKCMLDSKTEAKGQKDNVSQTACKGQTVIKTESLQLN